MKTPPARKETPRPSSVLGLSQGVPAGESDPHFDGLIRNVPGARTDATRSTTGVWVDTLAMVFRLHRQGASGLAFAKQKVSHALEDTLLLLAHNVSEDEPNSLRSAALSIWISSEIVTPRP